MAPFSSAPPSAFAPGLSCLSHSARDPGSRLARDFSGLPEPRQGALAYRELDLTLDREGTLWCFMQPDGPPSYTNGMLRELAEMQASIRRMFADAPAGAAPLRHFVLGSRLPGIFNLGGDLRLFADCIRRNDRARLAAYALACIEVLYNNYVAFNLPVTTVALVQGDALGGGFESALACDVIVAEKSAKFGLPEILFGLFPGMGAFSLLSRKLDAARAERMMLSGRIYSAEDLQEMGLIEVLAEDGRGEEALRDYLARNARRRQAHFSVFQMRRRINPLGFEELRDVIGMWVDAALTLGESELRKMERLRAAQQRRIAKTVAAEAAE